VLTAVLSLAEAHRVKLEDGDPLAGALGTIARACTRGREVVKDLLYFARKDVVEPTRAVDLNALVTDLVQLLGRTTLMRITILTDLEEGLPFIQGDAGVLSNVLMNLCMNAVDAMPQGGELWLCTQSSGDGRVLVQVRDTGEGMDPEVLKRAIEPFYTTKPAGKGTGLGLSMVYGAVKAHGGSLELQSELGRGTEVLLRFPVMAETVLAESAGLGVETGSAKNGVRQALRVLLVDDDDLIRMSVAPMLEMLGHQVETAESGGEALAHLEAGLEVDLVILDMNMPGLSGAQTLPKILALRPHQAVLIASGYRDEESQLLLKGRPNLDSLQKPFTLDEIRSKLNRVILHRAEAEQAHEQENALAGDPPRLERVRKP
jgi:CheY-like chemotaxis protein